MEDRINGERELTAACESIQIEQGAASAVVASDSRDEGVGCVGATVSASDPSPLTLHSRAVFDPAHSHHDKDTHEASWASQSSAANASLSGGGGCRGEQGVGEGAKSSGKSSEVGPTPYHHRSCPICLESFSDDNPYKMLPCKHAFHVQCIEEWRQRSRQCPMCQSLFMGSDVLEDGGGNNPTAAAHGANGAAPMQSAETLEERRRRTEEDEALARRLAREEEAAAMMDRRARSAAGMLGAHEHHHHQHHHNVHHRGGNAWLHASSRGGFTAVLVGRSGHTRRSQRHLCDGESDDEDERDRISASSGEGEGGMRSFTSIPRIPQLITGSGDGRGSDSSSDESQNEEDEFAAFNNEASSLVLRENEGSRLAGRGASVAPSTSDAKSKHRRQALPSLNAPTAFASSSDVPSAQQQQHASFFRKLTWFMACCRGGERIAGEDDTDEEEEAGSIRLRSK